MIQGGVTPRFYRLMIAALAAAAVLIAAYWITWFFVDRAWLATLDTRAYDTFENAFPAADAWLAVACASAAWSLNARRPSAMFWLIAAGSAGVYLAAMDVLFDLQNGVYALGSAAAFTELAINVASLGLGGWAMWFGWHHRKWLLG